MIDKMKLDLIQQIRHEMITSRWIMGKMVRQYASGLRVVVRDIRTAQDGTSILVTLCKVDNPYPDASYTIDVSVFQQQYVIDDDSPGISAECMTPVELRDLTSRAVRRIRDGHEFRLGVPHQLGDQIFIRIYSVPMNGHSSAECSIPLSQLSEFEFVPSLPSLTLPTLPIPSLPFPSLPFPSIPFPGLPSLGPCNSLAKADSDTWTHVLELRQKVKDLGKEVESLRSHAERIPCDHERVIERLQENNLQLARHAARLEEGIAKERQRAGEAIDSLDEAHRQIGAMRANPKARFPR